MSNAQRLGHVACVNLCAGYEAGNYKSRNINFEVAAGELMAIMGPSGSGKSTLLKGLQGVAPFSSGEVWANGENLGSAGLRSVRHRVGEVPQDDILVDELSARENIRYFNTIAVDSKLSRKETDARISTILEELGIEHIADMQVGNTGATRKNISGGQRKRINIAMELVNDPDILIIDEPTSGLSSHDSLELVKNLKRIAAQGRIVIIIIHQPSSEIFEQFDRLLILDGQGNCVRSGKRDEVVAWFEKQSDKPFRHQCAWQNFYFPDRLLETIEQRKEKASDDAGKYWPAESERFAAEFAAKRTPQEKSPLPEASFQNPLEAIKDFWALTKRQLKIKLRDRMSKILTLAAPLLLGVLMAVVFRSSTPGHDYSFADNGMFPQLLFMLIICGMFLGLVSSIFEVIKDRGMLEREAKRDLSMFSYLGAEFVTLSIIVAIQTTLLLGAGFLTIDAPGALFAANWGTLFLVGLVAISCGLLVSVLFSSPIAAYNMIPLILIPQIILGGALLPFANMGKVVYLWEDHEPNRQPVLSRLMPASRAYEAAMVASHEASKEAGLAMNVALKALEEHRQGDFLALQNEQSLRQSLLDMLGEEKARGSSVLVNKALLTLFLVFFLLSAWVWLRRDYDSRPGAGARGLKWQVATAVVVPLISLLLLEKMPPAPARTVTTPATPAVPGKTHAPAPPQSAAKTAPAKPAAAPMPPTQAGNAPPAAARHQASFDCTKAQSRIEKIICSSGELSELDRTMAKQYRAVLARAQAVSASKADIDEFKRWHRAALDRRNALIQISEIRGFYLDHNKALQDVLCQKLKGC